MLARASGKTGAARGGPSGGRQGWEPASAAKPSARYFRACHEPAEHQPRPRDILPMMTPNEHCPRHAPSGMRHAMVSSSEARVFACSLAEVVAQIRRAARVSRNYCRPLFQGKPRAFFALGGGRCSKSPAFVCVRPIPVPLVHSSACVGAGSARMRGPARGHRRRAKMRMARRLKRDRQNGPERDVRAERRDHRLGWQAVGDRRLAAGGLDQRRGCSIVVVIPRWAGPGLQHGRFSTAEVFGAWQKLFMLLRFDPNA
jgi:hypothetical protein